MFRINYLYSVCFLLASYASAGTTDDESDTTVLHPLLCEEAAEAVSTLRDEYGIIEPREVLRNLAITELGWVDEEGVEYSEMRVEVDLRRGDLTEVADEAHASGEELLACQQPNHVEQWLAGGVSEQQEEIEIYVGHQMTSIGTAADAVAVAMLEGRISSERDIKLARMEYVENRRIVGMELLAETLDLVESIGGKVVEVRPFVGTATVLLERTQADALIAARPDVFLDFSSRIEEEEDDPGQTMVVDAPYVDGLELTDLIQAQQFYDEGYYGEDYVGNVAVLEGNADLVLRQHVGFDGRFENCTEDSGECYNTAPTTSQADSHATSVASIAIGDITGGQDKDITDPDERWMRSGIARLAGGFGIDWLDASFTEDQLLDSGNDIYIAVSSAGLGNGTCSGATSDDRDADAYYEGGVAFFKSAGNNYHSTNWDCTVSQPGSAMGVFTVGAHSLQQIGGDTEEVIWSAQSLGGTSTEGRGRTIIDISAPTKHEWTFDSTNISDYDLGFGGTSGAAPVVAGAAALFREWYRTEKSTLIDDPGILYANMLLMGDRYEGDSTPRTIGFSNLWGAGRLRMRKFDSGGMDGPHYWATGTRCVDDGENKYVDLGTGDVPSDVEVVKAVIWWYDPSFDNSSSHFVDEIELALQQYEYTIPPGIEFWTTLVEDTGTDTKKRVFLANAPNETLRLRIKGEDIRTDNAGCGTNSMKVYFAAFYEDSDREAAEYMDDIRQE